MSATATMNMPQKHSDTTDISELEKSVFNRYEAIITQTAELLDLLDTKSIITYGLDVQRKMARTTNSAFLRTSNQRVEPVRSAIDELLEKLTSLSLPDLETIKQKGKFGLKILMTSLKSKYTNQSDEIQQIVNHLTEHLLVLMDDIDAIEKIQKKNHTFIEQMTVCILAGKAKIDDFTEKTLAPLKARSENGSTEDAIRLQQATTALDSFKRRLQDLEVSRTIALQFETELLILKNNDVTLSNLINQTLHNTIPVWQNQMTLALGIENSRRAIDAQISASDELSKRLHENAAKLERNTAELAKATKRGSSSMEELASQSTLLMDEIRRIQESGRSVRRSTEAKLSIIEKDLSSRIKP